MPSFIVKYSNREGDWKTVTCGEADHNCPPDYENDLCEWENREKAFEFAEKFQRDNDDVYKVLVKVKSAMTIPTMDEAVLAINKSIQRKKAAFELIRVQDGFGLVGGSHRAVKVEDGFIVSMRLTVEKMEYLKGQLEEALAQKRGGPDA